MNEIGMNVSAKFYGKYNTVKTLILTLKHKITKAKRMRCQSELKQIKRFNGMLKNHRTKVL